MCIFPPDLLMRASQTCWQISLTSLSRRTNCGVVFMCLNWNISLTCTCGLSALMFHVSRQRDRLEPQTVDVSVLNSSASVFCQTSTERAWMEAERSSWWVQSPHGLSQTRSECFVGCMCAWVCSIYIQQSCSLPWSLSDQPCSCRWGEVRLWFSSTVTLSIESTGCNFSMLLAEICASLCCSSVGPAADADPHSSLNWQGLLCHDRAV